ncbi:MAG: hypothetical protein MAG715_00083 [Methanonatronarchaeales archaeon]|nr:hypothetical protein [Methanonatronarchaeales archaeon]
MKQLAGEDQPIPIWGAGVLLLIVGAVILQNSPDGVLLYVGLVSTGIGILIFLVTGYKISQGGLEEGVAFLSKDSPITPPDSDLNTDRRTYRDPANQSQANQRRKELTQRKKNEIKYERANEVCEACGTDTKGTSLSLHAHHITPLEEGGTNNDSNLIAVCPNCHDRAHGGALSKNELKYKVQQARRS